MSTGQDPSGRGPRRKQRAQDDTFADVLNGFSFGSGRRGRKSADPAPSEAPQAAPRAVWEPPASQGPPGHRTTTWQPQPEEVQSAASSVRAYAWTGGRTRSQHHFEIETLVTTSDLGHHAGTVTHPDHRTVLALCEQPRSVAEVAALLSVPWGVAKVLLGDMAGRGLIVVHRTAAMDGDLLDTNVVERVLAGLRRL
ncbi:DUF742 domain-containing protein [Kitasatospora azatica]|uniref:DUF742 domain-containing protein n=1 Tax=Kitasatospora azatica TaxID=58347 RepID=UPI0006910AE8|nr:DUF742 domain-containing protein [Kitasatospora azatica]